jgi:hypothetical protein
MIMGYSSGLTAPRVGCRAGAENSLRDSVELTVRSG